MNTYKYYLLSNGMIVGVQQPERRYTHIGDLLSVRVFVRVAGKQYDGSIGEYGVAADILKQAMEVSPATAALREPRLVRYIEAIGLHEAASYIESDESQRMAASTDRVLI